MTKDSDDVAEAKKNATRAMDWEYQARTNFKRDVRFGNADAYNGDQWPEQMFLSRNLVNKPALTINKTRQHCLQIVNDARQNKPGVEIRPVGGGASYDASEIYEGIVRHIEYVSNAQLAYDAASWNQVFGGWGYFRVVTDFAYDTSFDQEIFIRRVANPLNVLMDPDIQEFDGSDARWTVYFEDLPRSEVEAMYPEVKDIAGASVIGDDEWNGKDKIRIAEYFRKREKPDVLIQLPDGSTEMKSKLPREIVELLADAPQRDVLDCSIEWMKIVGDKVVDRKDWPGRYVPFVRVIGEEVVIDGRMDRKGHVRALIDPQRMYNYWSSGAVESVALQSKTPYIASTAAVEGLETYWDTANTENHAYLPYKHADDAGNPIPPPSRQEPPQMSQAFINGTQMAQQEMMLVSGQYQAVMGAQSNETSGKAINARQRQGDNATYHYIDHLAVGIRFLGKILIDLIPKIYDTKRVLQILAKDDSRKSVTIDPGQKGPVAMQGQNGQPVDPADKQLDNPDFAATVQTIFNPAIGQYDVMADVGPSYATARQEAFNAFSQLMQQNPEAARISLDLWALSADFPGAGELAKRAKAMLPPAAQGGPSPEMQQMHQQMEQGAQQAIQHIEGLQKQVDEMTRKLADKSADIDRERYEAETKRLDLIGRIDPNLLKPFFRAEATEIAGHPIMDLVQAHTQADQAMMPQPAPQMPMGVPNGQ